MARKLAVAIVGLVALAALLSAGSHFWFASKANASAESLRTALARKAFSGEELREDVASLEKLLTGVHPAEISSFPLGDYEVELQALNDSLEGPLDHLDFYRKLAPVANRLNDEHTMVFPPEDENREPGFPIAVHIRDGQLFAASSPSGDSGIQPGDELLSVNGQDAASLIETLSSYYSGTGERQKQTYLEWDFSRALSRIFDMHPPFAVRFRNANGDSARTAELGGVDRVEPAVDNFSFSAMGPNALHFSYNAFEDEDGQFDEFLAGMFLTAREQNIGALIIDLRRNQGGAAEYGDRVIAYLTDQPFTQLRRVDVTVSDAVKQEFLGYVPGFLRWLPVQYLHPYLRPLWTNDIGATASIEFDLLTPADNPLSFAGQVYVLIGPGTMSSASLFAATIRHYGLGTLVGEQTGGYATMYGNIVDARLPNSGLKVWMPTSVVYGHGDGPVLPDHEIVQTIEDLAESRDTVLDYVLSLASEN